MQGKPKKATCFTHFFFSFRLPLQARQQCLRRRDNPPILILSFISTCSRSPLTSFYFLWERSSHFSLEFSLDLLAFYEALSTVYGNLSLFLLKLQLQFPHRHPLPPDLLWVSVLSYIVKYVFHRQLYPLTLFTAIIFVLSTPCCRLPRLRQWLTRGQVDLTCMFKSCSPAFLLSSLMVLLFFECSDLFLPFSFCFFLFLFILIFHVVVSQHVFK